MFKTGDWVVCIRKSAYPDLDGEIGKIYQVSMVANNHIHLVNQKAAVGLSPSRFRLATPNDFTKDQSVPVKLKEPSAEKQQMKKQLDELREKLHTLEKIYNKMD